MDDRREDRIGRTGLAEEAVIAQKAADGRSCIRGPGVLRDGRSAAFLDGESHGGRSRSSMALRKLFAQRSADGFRKMLFRRPASAGILILMLLGKAAAAQLSAPLSTPPG